MRTTNDLTGKTFGRLRVLGLSKTKHRNYICACSCGCEKEILKESLVHGITRSCGCLKIDHGRKMGREKKLDVSRSCSICKAEFRIQGPNQKYCSKECSEQHHRTSCLQRYYDNKRKAEQELLRSHT